MAEEIDALPTPATTALSEYVRSKSIRADSNSVSIPRNDTILAALRTHYTASTSWISGLVSRFVRNRGA